MIRLAVRVRGTVQGVGFRPFVYGVASGLGLAGHVGNDERGVLLEAEGPEPDLRALVSALREGPPLAVVTGVECAPLPVRGERGFVIVASSGHDRSAATTVPPDSATCADCLAELRDPGDRRYRHPFVNCTNCGPRLTIVTGVPYDRATTTMAAFGMCPDCAAEYENPADRRFHAQPVCCPACGPTLRFTRFTPSFPNERHLRAVTLPEGAVRSGGAAIDAAAAALRAGAVLAVKGLGGYHLAVRAADEDAVRTLRGRKHREDRSFAVAVPDLAAARALCHVDDDEAALLSSHRAPIVLLRRRAGARVADAVAPGDPCLGLMLPYTPVHHLLLDAVREPIVLTSGNVSDEPIAHRDDDAAERLGPIADGVLAHDRPIRTRADDSVVSVVRGRPYPVRRSRGYAPEPIPIAPAAARPVLGVGAELKNTFCLLDGHQAVVSHHIGDLANAETLRAFTDGVAHLSRLLDVVPEVVAHDLHPEYLSTKWALDRAASDPVELVGVQHHHAHLAGCLAEHGETGPAIGIACDGTGFGTDGTLWGGEIFDVSLAGFERVAHLKPVPLPGGSTAIREPWRTAAAWLWALDEPAPAAWAPVRSLLDAHAAGRLRQPVTTGAGRLFDAVAALCGVRDRITYEGQAAIELERLVDPDVRDGYPVPPPSGPPRAVAAGGGDRAPVVLRAGDLVRAVLADRRAGVGVPVIAARFHFGLAAMLVDAAAAAARDRGRDTVALSGGVFANLVLLEAVRAGLEGTGLRVLVHSRVPCNDGGVSLGQVAVAAAAQ